VDTDTASHEHKVVVVEVSCEGRLNRKAAVMVIRLTARRRQVQLLSLMMMADGRTHAHAPLLASACLVFMSLHDSLK
jgi:hypothetical protein